MEKFIELFEEALDIDNGELNIESQFKDFDEWDSLSLLSLLAMVKENYGIVLKKDKLDQANTIAELFEIIQEELK